MLCCNVCSAAVLAIGWPRRAMACVCRAAASVFGTTPFAATGAVLDFELEAPHWDTAVSHIVLALALIASSHNQTSREIDDRQRHRRRCVSRQREERAARSAVHTRNASTRPPPRTRGSRWSAAQRGTHAARRRRRRSRARCGAISHRQHDDNGEWRTKVTARLPLQLPLLLLAACACACA